jgi:hypothetical protein
VVRDFGERHAAEEPAFDDAGLVGVVCRKRLKGVVPFEQLVFREASREGVQFQRFTETATGFLATLAACVIDQESANRWSSRGEEVPAILEPLLPDQPKLRLVDEDGGVERLAGLLLGHLRGGELPQLLGDQRQQLRGGLTIAAVGRFQESGDVGHGKLRSLQACS